MARKKRRRLSDSLEKARDRLAQNGNRLTLICALLVWMSSFLFYRIFYVGIAILISIFSMGDGGILLLLSVFLGVSLLFTLFVVAPLFYGIMMMAMRMARGENLPLSAVFDSFSDGRLYRRTVKLADEGVLGSSLVTAILYSVACGAVTPFLREGAPRVLTCVGIALVAIVILFCFESRRFWKMGLALSNPEMPLRAIRRDVKKARQKRRWTAFPYWWFFLPRMLLGILTIGIYLLADVLPMMMLTYFCEFEKTQELMIHLEENKDHE